MKKVLIILVPEAETAYVNLLEPDSRGKPFSSIFKAVNAKVGLIKADIHYGDPIAKNLFLREYVTKYEISNLLRVELPGFWRMNGNDDREIVALVHGIMDYSD